MTTCYNYNSESTDFTQVRFHGTKKPKIWRNFTLKCTMIFPGLLLKLSCWDNVYGDDMFDDRQFFEVEAQGFPSNGSAGDDMNETENDVKL